MTALVAIDCAVVPVESATETLVDWLLFWESALVTALSALLSAVAALTIATEAALLAKVAVDKATLTFVLCEVF